ncbi:MAG TPA: hypothetical protein VKQ06_02375 [Gammaproteobacteria bacterium]|nr:hypothetical protein [Gammaproteobacteria bacterium]
MSHIHDPELEFGDPKRLAMNPDLSLQRKLEVLESWRLDLIELQRAEDENMRGLEITPGATAKRLADVSSVLALLEREMAKEAGAGHSNADRKRKA